MANVFKILDRRPFDFLSFDATAAFDLGSPVQLPESCVITDPGWTLFSFDFKRNEAVFLDIGEDCDLSVAPFSYQMQYARALRILVLPFVSVTALAGQIKTSARLVHLFNIGHCGSTLLHHVFNRAGGVWCLSEPLFSFDAAMRRDEFGEAALHDLLQAGLRFLELFPGASDADVIVVKHFSQATAQIPVYALANPTAKRLFLYREGNAWCNSVYHFAQRMGTELHLDRKSRHFIWWILSGGKSQDLLNGLVDMKADRVGFDELAAVAWVLQLRDDVLVACKDVQLLPLRYEELNTQRETMIKKVFAHCGIDPSHIPAALTAFDADAHAGSMTSREVPALDFGTESFAVLEQIFAHRLMLFPANTVLPGSLLLPPV